MTSLPSLPPATAPARYVFPERALRRWIREALTLQAEPDGGLSARFRFEGSTCGNIPFVLWFLVRLDASPARVITSLRCEVAPYDEGHQRMCCWQEDAVRAAALLEQETPLLARPLDAVLTWRPTRSPAGCLCTASSRDHKWQAVLETLHLALQDPTNPAPPTP